jgi:hypothetical protein
MADWCINARDGPAPARGDSFSAVCRVTGRDEEDLIPDLVSRRVLSRRVAAAGGL